MQVSGSSWPDQARGNSGSPMPAAEPASRGKLRLFQSLISCPSPYRGGRLGAYKGVRLLRRQQGGRRSRRLCGTGDFLYRARLWGPHLARMRL